MKIEGILKKLGTAKLNRLYGEDKISSIASILQNSINEIKIVQLIFLKFGTQLLSNKNIRLAVISSLNNEERYYILYGIKNSTVVLNKIELLELTQFKWSRKSEIVNRLIEVLELSEEYLPPIVKKTPSVNTIVSNLTLYPHQRRIKDSFVRKLVCGDKRIMLHMPTGAGKTRTCVEGIIDYWKTIADRKKNIVWVAHSEELCEQSIETFEKIWAFRGDENISIYRLWGTHSLPDNFSGGIIVAGFQKLYSMISSADNETFMKMSLLSRNTEVLVIDEAHKSIAPTYKKCIDFLLKSESSKLIGLTATPGRNTNDIISNIGQSETKELSEYYNNNKLSLTDEFGCELANPINFLQELKFLSKIERKKVNTNIKLELTDKDKQFLSTFLELPKNILLELANNDERNALILAEIALLRQKNIQIIVFALSVDHAHLISELLNLSKISARCIDGATPPSERKKYIEEYKNSKISVLVNYGVLTTGFDAPNTQAVVITRPTTSLVLYSQMIGRGIRGPRVGGNEICYLVDLEDNLVGFPSENSAFNFFNEAWS